MTEKDIALKLLGGWMPDCKLDDIRQGVVAAWNGDENAANNAARAIARRLKSTAKSTDNAERRAERQAELAAENWVGGFCD
jgi:hypothetical protein